MTTRDRENKQNKNQTAPVVLVEVQPEAEEAQALVWAVDQQHQEVLDDALRAEEGGEDHVLCTLENIYPQLLYNYYENPTSTVPLHSTATHLKLTKYFYSIHVHTYKSYMHTEHQNCA